jgi:hypothetical protein
MTDEWFKEKGFEKLNWGWYKDGFIFRSGGLVKCYPGTKEPHYTVAINIKTEEELRKVWRQHK